MPKSSTDSTSLPHCNYLITGLVLCSLIALIPEYLIRCNLNISWWFYQAFSTYYGDLWYVWNNFLSHGFPYPREYPSLIQLIFRVIALIPGTTSNYSYYMLYIVTLLSLCAMISTYLLCKLQKNIVRVIWLWILAPSYLFYGLLNVDFIPILTIILSYYYFGQNKHIPAGIWLAIGTAIKVFPIFLLPVYFFSCDSHQKKRELLIVFIVTWLTINIPFMMYDWNAWVFPYIWQIQSNFARSPSDGSWTWLLFRLFDYYGHGEWSGRVSLIIFASSYFYLIRKYWQLPLIRKLTLVIMLFLLTDRVYSPQYDLYLLPFLVLLDYKVNWKYFYLLEIPNLLQVFFCFALKHYVILEQSLIATKYIALIALMLQLLREPTEQILNTSFIRDISLNSFNHKLGLQRRIKKLFCYEVSWWALSIIIGAGYAYYLCAPLISDPTNISLIPYGDMQNQFIGISEYLRDSWHWPLTYTSNIVYPHGLAINFVDCMPLIAIITKLFVHWLPSTFILQPYLIVINCILQFYCGSLIFRTLRNDRLLAVIGGIFILSASILSWRIMRHNSLTFHWIILLSIFLIIKPVAKNYMKDFRKQIYLLVVACGIHPYILGMLIPFSAVHIIKIIATYRLHIWQIIKMLMLLSISLIAATYLFGYLSIASINDAGDVGYGYYSMNLIYLVYPTWNSLIFKAFHSNVNDSYEGMCYLGLGIMAMLAILVVFDFKHCAKKVLQHKTLTLMCVLLFLFSMSTTITYGNYVVANFNYNNLIFNMFRSSGRFIWPVFYVIIIATVVYTYDFFNYRAKQFVYGILCIALLIQLADLAPLCLLVHNAFNTPKVTMYKWNASLANPFWNNLKNSHYKHIEAPIYECDKFGILASVNGMSIGKFCLSRTDNGVRNAYIDMDNNFINNNLQTDTIYIVPDDMMHKRSLVINNSECTVIDNYNVCHQ